MATKKQILQGICNNLKQYVENVEPLYKLIQNGTISISDIEACDQRKSVKDRVLAQISELEDTKQRCEIAWSHASQEDSLDAYNDFLKEYPDSGYTEKAEERIKELEEKRQREWEAIQDERQKEIEKLLKDIKERRKILKFEVFRSDYIETGLISKERLFEEGIITENQWDVLMNPRNNDDLGEQSNLPPLIEESTDIYFIGWPGSGKSCLLAGILYQAQVNNGYMFDVDINNKLGFDYAQSLIRRIAEGYIPPRTPGDHMNYISNSIFKESNKVKHSFNFVELSGEVITKSFDEPGKKQQVWTEQFLMNKNRKHFYFIIDYEVAESGYTSLLDQHTYLLYFLKSLIDKGIMRRTDSIQLVVTKSDLFPEGERRLDYGNSFLMHNYGNFVKLIKEQVDDYGMNAKQKEPIVHTWSLGRFIFEELFEYDHVDSGRIFESIIAYSFGRKPKSSWTKLWTN